MIGCALLKYINKNILEFIKILIPKFIKKKIKKKFFPYYFLITDYHKLPISNYNNINSLEKQKNLIEKFNLNQEQSSFMSCPYLHQLLLMKYDPDDDFTFLDIGGEYIDFFLELRKNFKNVKYYIFNLEKITNDFSQIKLNYEYKNLNIITQLDTILNNKFDFINFGSCIQYFDNYEVILNCITEKNSQILFSGTTLFESNKEIYKKFLIVKQVNVLPEINYCYFFNRDYFLNFFLNKKFNLVFEKRNITDNVNFTNFTNLFSKIEYKDIFFKKN